MKYSIKNKLMGLLVLAVAALFIVGTMGIFGMQRMNRARGQMKIIEANAVQSQQAVNKMLDLRIQLREALVNAADPEARAASVDDIKNLNESLYTLTISLRDTVMHPDSPGILDELEELYEWLMVQEMNDYYNLALSGNAEGMQAWLRAHITYALHYQDLCQQLCALEQDMAQSIEGSSARQAFILNVGAILLLILCCSILLVQGAALVKNISEPLLKLVQASESLAEGDLDVNVDISSNDETGKLSNAFQKMIRSISLQAEAVHAVSNGDYTVNVQPRSKRDVMGQSLMTMVTTGNEVMSEIREASKMVSSGAEQVSQIAQNLSFGASTQKESIEAFAIIIQEVVSGANEHADTAQESLNIADKLRTMVEHSNEDMNAVMAAMASINTSTEEAASIIKLIEDIAFQTSILSINAAIEAASAGEHGSGFAVVADEIRNLSVKSAESVSKISALITDCRQRVKEGNQIVDISTTRFADMKKYILESHRMFESMSVCPVRKMDRLNFMKQGIEQINSIVQDNFTSSQEAASTAEELNAQAEVLADLTAQFKLVNYNGKIG